MTTTTARLVRTGDCRITIRNAAGLHLTYRVNACKAWEDRQGRTQPGIGYWISVRSGDDWVRCGKLREDGTPSATRNQTDDRVALYGAMVVGQALLAAPTDDTEAEQTWYVEVANRSYHVGLEHRCGACGRELTDLVSIQRGLGPHCYGVATGSKAAKVTA